MLLVVGKFRGSRFGMVSFGFYSLGILKLMIIEKLNEVGLCWIYIVIGCSNTVSFQYTKRLIIFV